MLFLKVVLILDALEAGVVVDAGMAAFNRLGTQVAFALFDVVLFIAAFCAVTQL